MGMDYIKETFQFEKDIPIKINLHQEKKSVINSKIIIV